MNIIELKSEQSPSNDEFILGSIGLTYEGNNLIFRPEPLIMFKKNSKFRLFCERILQDKHIFSTHTILYYKNKDWFDHIEIVSKEKYDF